MFAVKTRKARKTRKYTGGHVNFRVFRVFSWPRARFSWPFRAFFVAVSCSSKPRNLVVSWQWAGGSCKMSAWWPSMGFCERAQPTCTWTSYCIAKYSTHIYPARPKVKLNDVSGSRSGFTRTFGLPWFDRTQPFFSFIVANFSTLVLIAAPSLWRQSHTWRPKLYRFNAEFDLNPSGTIDAWLENTLFWISFRSQPLYSGPSQYTMRSIEKLLRLRFQSFAKQIRGRSPLFFDFA